ncbi:MAG TPA: XRE family transcriptional regulator, partial [Burkholderiaceae bacterium]|nr:XRE family transcriptional regulator [Burkholderiaceae bacterium]
MAKHPAPSAGDAAAIAAMTPPKVGQEIQRLRTQRNMTLEDLSRAAGVSKSMLSEIERNRANPTIAVVWRLTNALGITLDHLFANPKTQDTIQVMAAHESPTLSSQAKGYQLRVWGPIELAGKFEWYELVLQPGGALESDPHDPGTQEHLTVVSGTIEVTASDNKKVVQEGQTARYPADVRHVLRNTTSESVKALLVVVHAGV